jgi:erythromycin esterase
MELKRLRFPIIASALFVKLSIARWSALVLLLFLATTSNAKAVQASDNFALASWAKAHATLIKLDESRITAPDFRSFNPLIGDAHVVALGEPTHGAHEPLAIRNTLFRYAVEKLGFTAIALETGLPESKAVAAYVAGGPGNVAQIVRDNFTWGFGSFQENVELVQWMRVYNANPAHRRKIRFYGIDLSLGGPSGSTPTATAIEQALAYLDAVDPASAQQMRLALSPFIARLPASPIPFSRQDHDRLTAAIADLVSLFQRKRPHYLAVASKQPYDWAYRDAIVARPQDQEFRVVPDNVAGGGIPPAAWRAMSVRNESMAENVKWVLEQEGVNGRVLVFAHDMHIMNAPTSGGSWSVLERAPNSMGQYLRSMLGKDLAIIGIFDSAPSDSAAGENRSGSNRNFIEDAFGRIARAPFAIDLRQAVADRSTSAWLSQPHEFRVNNGDFLKVVPAEAFDVLVFVQHLTSSRQSFRK